MKQKPEDQYRQDLKFQFAGWGIFILCAILYIVSSLQNMDTWAFIGSIFFLIACLIFLIPLFGKIKETRDFNNIHNEGRTLDNANPADAKNRVVD